VLPPDVAAQSGLVPGARMRLEPTRNGLRLHRSVTHLAKVYVEPTNACNLDCATCFRHGWDEPIGRMSEVSFAAFWMGWPRWTNCPPLFRRDWGAAVATGKRSPGWRGARVRRTHRADHERDAAQRPHGRGSDRRRVGFVVVSTMVRARRATPTCGWAPSWSTSSPT